MSMYHEGHRELQGLSAADRPQVELVAAADPECRVPMIAQLIAGVRMQEHVQRTMIEREPAQHGWELSMRERDLVAPTRMWTDRFLVKSPERDPIAQVCRHGFPEVPRCVTALCVEIDMRVPAFDGAHIGFGAFHHRPPMSARRIDPKRFRYRAGVRLTWRRNKRLKKPASSCFAPSTTPSVTQLLTIGRVRRVRFIDPLS